MATAFYCLPATSYHPYRPGLVLERVRGQRGADHGARQQLKVNVDKPFDTFQWRLQRCQRRLADLFIKEETSLKPINKTEHNNNEEKENHALKRSVVTPSSVHRGQGGSDEDDLKEISRDKYDENNGSKNNKEEKLFMKGLSRDIQLKDSITNLSRSGRDCLERGHTEKKDKEVEAVSTIANNKDHQHQVGHSAVASAFTPATTSTTRTTTSSTPRTTTSSTPRASNWTTATTSTAVTRRGSARSRLTTSSRPSSQSKRLRSSKWSRTPSSSPTTTMANVKELTSRSEELDSLIVTIDKWITSVSMYYEDPTEDPCFRPCTEKRNNEECKNNLTTLTTEPLEPYTSLLHERDLRVQNNKVDALSRPHGQLVHVALRQGDSFLGDFRQGQRHGQGCLRRSEGRVRLLEGLYVQDQLNGVARAVFEDESEFVGVFRKGVRHGLGKTFVRSKEGHMRLSEVALFHRGLRQGTVWRFLRGGGAITGEVDGMTGQLIGDHVAFLYPDHKTALVGTFVKDRMLMAHLAFPQLVHVSRKHGYAMCQVRFTQTSGSTEVSSPIFSLDVSTSTCISSEPLLRDPYESQMVYVRRSRINGADEGLFALQDVAVDVVVAFYNGVRLESSVVDQDDKTDWPKHAFKIMDMEEREPKLVLDIPEAHRSLKRYSASLAHKANHSFTPNCRFALFDHPRFGPVPSLRSLRPIDKDTELTVSYDYALDEAPPWYQQLFAQRVLQQYRQARNL